MKKFLVVTVASALMLGAATVIVFAASFDNGGFETGPTVDPIGFTTLYLPSTSINGWSVDSGSIDYIGSYWQAADGARSIDLNGFTAGSISQTFTTVKGATYKVDFALSGNPDGRTYAGQYWSPDPKIVAVSATGNAAQSFDYNTAEKNNTLSNMLWVGHTYTFVATGTSTTLTFASQIVGAFGPALDNVSIKETLPGNKDECKKDGWQSFGVFKNQGDCVSYVATGGKNLPAGK